MRPGEAAGSERAMENREFSRAECLRAAERPERLRREGPFIESLLDRSPRGGLVIDAGCGPGAHARFLSSRGERALGIDRSRAALAEAAAAGPGPLFCRGDLRALPVRSGVARAVLCLGNTLLLLGEEPEILRALAEFRRVLLPRGTLLVQILNYTPLRRENRRHLPLDFRPAVGRSGGEAARGAELVHLRFLDFVDPEHVWFHAVVLERRPGSDEATVRESALRRIRTLAHDEVRTLAEEAGFRDVSLFGDYRSSAFDPASSSDIVLTAVRA